MRSSEEASASAGKGRALTEPAMRVLKARFPDSPDPLREWLPPKPLWRSGIPDTDILEMELRDLRRRGGKVVLYGHDDMDGVTGLYTGRTILSGEGYRVRTIFPESPSEEYGLLPERMEGILRRGDLLLTVDYGCTSTEGVRWAVERGARVVVTDHHTMHEPLPPSHGMVNPQRNGPPSSHLAGCAVLYAALVSVFPRWENRPDLLAAVALGTVSDRVPFLGWNRYLLDMFSQVDDGELQGGLRVVAEEWPARRRAWTGAMVRQAIASVVGRGEGSGILEFLDFLSDDDYARCRKTWRNMRRESAFRARRMTEIFSRAIGRLDGQASAYGMNLVFVEDLPSGMGGTLAGKLSRITRRGAIVVSRRGNGRLAGEARSAGDWDMADLLVGMGRIFTSAGGHRMAAGFSADGLSWEELRESLLSRMAEYPVAPVPLPHVDLEVSELPDPSDFLCLAPFGGGFLPPALKKEGMRYLLNVGENTASWFITEESGD